MISKYIRTNNEDILENVAKIIFNEDISRTLPLNIIEPYMTIIFKKVSRLFYLFRIINYYTYFTQLKMYVLVSKKEAKIHKEFFNKCIESFLNIHNKRDLFNNQKEFVRKFFLHFK